MVFGRVYSIRSHQTKDLYIGSTTQALSMRMSGHRKHYRFYLNKKTHYITSFKILQYNDAYIELLFEGEFESKDALRQKEGEYMRDMECVNRCIAGRTQQEYYEENKEHILENRKQYYDEHKEQLSECKKKYQHEHKEQLIEYHKQYRDENKDKISEQKKQKFTCECGLVCCINHKARHERSLKHQKFINSYLT